MLTLCCTGKSAISTPPIDMLPDELLLEIFDWDDWSYDEQWHALVHVCQRWRQIAFASSRRLRLGILCCEGTPVRKYLGIWPDLPISLEYLSWGRSITADDEDNILAALEHPDRVRAIALDLTGSMWEKVVTVMKEPFPELRHLSCTSSKDGNTPIFPPKFLGGHAPFCLDEVDLWGIPFPALPTLLLSASNLRRLSLSKIPPTGYISPEAIVASLATLPRLDDFMIEFQSATSRPNRIDPPPVTRAVLSALTTFRFTGASEYLEDLVARIDSPRLSDICIQYFNQFIDFQVAQFSKFISRSAGLKPALVEHAYLTFSINMVSFDMYDPHAIPHTVTFRRVKPLTVIGILCGGGIDWQVSHMAQVLRHFLATLSHVIHLRLRLLKQYQFESTDDVEWHLLLHRFSAVQTLHVSEDPAGHIAVALEDMLEGMFAESLPCLNLIYLENQPASSVEKFVAARQRCGRVVTVVHTKAEYDERLRSMA